MTNRMVNRILFDKLKSQWDILKMSSAYILAERKIIEDAASGIDTTGHIAEQQRTIEFVSPEEFYQADKNKPMTIAEEILEKAREVREKLDDAIHNNNFVKAKMFQQILDGLEKQYNRFKDE